MKDRIKAFLKETKLIKKGIYFCISLILMFLLCWLLSETAFKTSRAIPSPAAAWAEFLVIWQKGGVFNAVWNTLGKTLIAFGISLALGFAAAVLSNISKPFRGLVEPVVSVMRAVPTLGATFVLFILVNGEITAIVIAILIIFPMIYSNLYGAIANTDKKLLEMASVYKVPLIRKIFGIFFPGTLPYLFSASLAGFGLGIKVVIAAEIICIPTRTTIGSYIFNANNSFNYPALFVWIIFAVALSMLCEAIIRIIMYCALPWKRKRRTVV